MWKILVVDDSRESGELVKHMLIETADCVVVDNGRAGEEAYRKALEERKPFDCVLLDIQMPNSTGIDVLNFIRAQEAEKGLSVDEGVPVLIVTAYKEYFIEAFNIGCNDYVLKPFEPEKLINKISQCVSKDYSI